MHELAEMLEEIICKLKIPHNELYKQYKMRLYEMAEGKKINEDMAYNWIDNMKPYGEHWTMDEANNVKNKNGIDADDIDWYVVMNMMYNDYHNSVGENDLMYVKLARDWLSDEDTKEHKLYNYYKYIAK